METACLVGRGRSCSRSSSNGSQAWLQMYVLCSINSVMKKWLWRFQPHTCLSLQACHLSQLEPTTPLLLVLGWLIELTCMHACPCTCRAGIDPYEANATAPYEIVSFTSCFHGRTMGALALTYKEQYKSPFLPVMPGHQ